MPVRADEVLAVIPGIWHWAAYDPAVKTELCSTAIRAQSGLVFIDPILLQHDALEELVSSSTPAAIVITSGNHTRASAWYRKRFGVPIYAHASAGLEAVAADETLEEGAVVMGDLHPVDLAGGAPGEVAIHAPAHSAVCIGDALINCPPYGFALLPDKYCDDPRTLRQNLRKLLPITFDLLTFAHGMPLVSAARQRLIDLLTA